MKVYQLTPWARRAMTDELRDTIEAAVPRDYLVTLGRGTAGWTCRILSPRQEGVIAEAYGQPSMSVAFMTAWSKVPVSA